jgi:hypothetical protein
MFFTGAMHVRHQQQEHHLRHDADQGPGHDQHHVRSRGTRPQVARARIFKLLWCPGINFKESIPTGLCSLASRYDNPHCYTRPPGCHRLEELIPGLLKSL